MDKRSNFRYLPGNYFSMGVIRFVKTEMCVMETYLIQPVLWLPHKNADGACRLKLCVSIGPRRLYVHTAFLIQPQNWNVLRHQVEGIPNESMVNKMIKYQISSVDRIIRERLAEGGEITARFLNSENRKPG